MPRSIINIADVELTPRSAQFSPSGARAELYDLEMSRIAPSLGAQKLGYNITAVAPGKRAFPFHSHRLHAEFVHADSAGRKMFRHIGRETQALDYWDGV